MTLTISIIAGIAFLYLLYVCVHGNDWAKDSDAILRPLVLLCTICWVITTTFFFELLMPGFPLGASFGLLVGEYGLLVGLVWLGYAIVKTEVVENLKSIRG